MSSLDDIEDEILLQSALLQSLDDAGISAQSSERKAINDKINELEARAEHVSATTAANDDQSSAPRPTSSRSSMASSDAFAELAMPGAWKPSGHPRGSKRPAHDTTTSPHKRVATELSLNTISGPSLTAANRMERYRQAEAAARARSQREREDAEIAAAMSRSDSAQQSSSQINVAESSRAAAESRSLAPPFRPVVRKFEPASDNRPPPSSQVKREASSSNVHAASNSINQPIDLTDDKVLPASWAYPGLDTQAAAAAHRERQRTEQLNALLGRRQNVNAQKATINARLAQAQQNLTQWRRYETEMAARGFPPGAQGDSNAMRAFTQKQLANAHTHIRNFSSELAFIASQSMDINGQYARLQASSRAYAAHPTYPTSSIYQPIKKPATGGRALGDLNGTGLGHYMNGLRAVPQQEERDLPEWTIRDYPEHYDIESEAPTDAQTAEDIQKMFDNMYQDDEAQLRAEEIELENMTVSLKPYQGIGLNWLQRQEEGSNKGGILADDMGLGKTIQAIALMSTRRSEDPLCKTTLIVAPVALLRQWQQEIRDKLKRGRHALNVFIHHGSTKMRSWEELRRFDVVLTTFGTMASEQRQYDRFIERKKNDRQATMTPSEKGIFTHQDAHWYRVILDEAQNIKNKNTRSAQGCCRIQAKYRFCMTGTPMMNSVDELYSLIHFLRIPPYNSYKKFQVDFVKPLKSRNEDFRKSAMVRLQALIKATLLRRHKKTKLNGRPILILPERNVVEEPKEFMPEERDFYNAVEQNSQTQYNKYVKAGSVGKHYAHILVMLLRLRQCCCHPHLVKDFGAVAAAAEITEETMVDLAGKLDEAVINRVKEREGAFECPVCFEATENPAIFVPCGHDTCSDCYSRICEAARAEDGTRDAKCPNCRGKINTKSVVDYETFKKVHQPAPADNAEPDADEVDTETEAGDETDSGSEIVTDDDDEGSLGGFIVDDDEEEAEVDEDEVETASEAEEDPRPEDDGDLQPSGYTGPCGLSEGKGKAKVKAIETEEPIKKRSKKKSRRRDKGKRKSKADKDAGRKKKKSQKKTLTLAEMKKASTKNKAAKKRYLAMIRKDWTSSTKIDASLEALTTIIKDTDEKVIVFSQWTSLLDLLEVPIDEKGWGYERYDGSMNAKARADAVDKFKDNRSKIRIMLISLKAGNAGLNLNTASKVIILDPFWNPYVEEQAIDRAHRLGQTRDVNVQRLLISETVEDRIMALQEKKRAMINEALDEGAGQRLSRLSQAELGFLFGVRQLNQ